MRAELLDRYRSLALPTTRDEHWRFTDLEGFDPDAWTADGVGRRRRAVDARPRRRGHRDDRRGRHLVSERVRDGIRFEPLRDDHPLLGSLVKPDDKFRAHNAAVWQHGLLVHVPAGVELEKPLYLRVASGVQGGSLFWRRPRRRRARLPLHARPGAHVGDGRARGVRQRRRRGRRRATARRPRSSTCSGSRGGVALRVVPRARRARRRARLGRGRLRLDARQGLDPERPRRPRRDLARHRRVLRRRVAAPRLRHVPAARGAGHDVATSPSRARSATRRRPSGAG